MNNELYRSDAVKAEHCHRSFSWTAVIAGALIATGLSFLLGLFDMGIGLTIVNNTQDGVQTVVVGGLLGMIIGSVVTMFVAGWVAGLLARHCCWNQHLGVLHGFAAWCLALIISIMLFSPQVDVLTVGSNMVSSNMAAHPISRMVAHNATPAKMVNAPANQPAPAASVEKSANSLGVGALIGFLIFFLGAISACIGGYYGACNRSCIDPNKMNRN